MDFKDALMEAAAKVGWAPIRIAAEIGFSEASVKNWMAGEQEPRLSAYLSLRKHLPGFAELMDEYIARQDAA